VIDDAGVIVPDGKGLFDIIRNRLAMVSLGRRMSSTRTPRRTMRFGEENIEQAFTVGTITPASSIDKVD